jgi:hypothetical protein
MSAAYDNSVLRFAYPRDWELVETPSDDGLTVNLQSPGSMFLFVTLYDRQMPLEELADEALAAMREEYPDLDACRVSQTIADQPAIGHDVNFFSLDLTNTCWIRAFASGRRSVLLFAQTDDMELQGGEQVFRAICESMELEGTHD